jgi:hypothetical protein
MKKMLWHSRVIKYQPLWNRKKIMDIRSREVTQKSILYWEEYLQNNIIISLQIGNEIIATIGLSQSTNIRPPA